MCDDSDVRHSKKAMENENIIEKVTETAFTDCQDKDLINLNIGAPGPDILNTLPSLLSRGTEQWMVRNSANNIFQYGPEVGIKTFRSELANFLTRQYRDIPVTPESLIVTTGATNGLHLAVSVLVDHEGVVFVEDPTYFIAIDILVRDLGLKVVPVLMDKEGMNTDDLERLVEVERANHSKGDRFWGVIYTIPNFHNPTGVSFSRKTGRKIIEIANKNNLLIVCDDVYNLLDYQKVESEDRYSRLLALDSYGVVLSNCTFSKLLAPGLRLGWIEGHSNLVKKLSNCGILLSGGCQNNLMSGIVTGMLELGLVDKHLDMVKQIFSQRMDKAVNLLKERLPIGWNVNNPQGGYFLWVEAPPERDLTNFCSWLKIEKSVSVMLGSKASPSAYLGKDHQKSNCCRLSIAYYTLDKIEEGCELFCQGAKHYFADKNSQDMSLSENN